MVPDHANREWVLEQARAIDPNAEIIDSDAVGALLVCGDADALFAARMAGDVRPVKQG